MTYIIAEAGTNHYAVSPKQRFENAIDLVFRAAMTGVDAVKFQMFCPDEPLFCPLEGDEKRWDRWKYTYMPFDDWFFVKEKCAQYNVDFLASVFQEATVQWIRELQPKYYKVASRVTSNADAEIFMLRQLPGPFIASRPPVPASDRARILINRMPNLGGGGTMQCIPEYPVALNRARWEQFHGLSDHSGSVHPGLDAIYRGARFLEVHFTLDGLDAGNDAPVCLTEKDLKLLCDARDAARQMSVA